MENDKIPSEQKTVNKEKSKIDINKYQDPTGLSAKNLNFGLWFAINKHTIIKIIIITLSVIAACSVFYATYGYVYYFVFGSEQEKILNQSNYETDLANYRLNNATANLQVLSVKVLNNRGSYDFVATVKNPNDKHYASLNYCFVLKAEKKCSSTFILPGEEKIIILPQQKTVETVDSINFEANNINWQKLNARTIPNWDVYKKERLNFSVTNLKNSSYGANLDYLEFDIVNNSAYSYFEVPLNIVARSNNEIIAINRYIVTELKSNETKSIRLYWPNVSSYGDAIEVIPDANIIDTSIFMPYREN